MAKFFVGQRVRIIRTYVTKNMLNMEARITALNVVGASPRGDYVGHRLNVRNSKGNVVVCRPEDIEPILDPGNRPGVKGECLVLDELLSREVQNETVK